MEGNLGLKVISSFSDRRDAGKKLMNLVKQFSHEIDLVLAIPKGGVEVAGEIARALGVPLNLVSAGEIASPATLNKPLAL